MRYNQQQIEDLLEKVEGLLSHDKKFSDSDLAAIDEMLKAWRAWTALGRGAKWVITALGLLAALLASMSAISKAIKDWVLS